MSFHLVYSLLLLQFGFGYAPFEHKSPGLLYCFLFSYIYVHITLRTICAAVLYIH